MTLKRPPPFEAILAGPDTLDDGNIEERLKIERASSRDVRQALEDQLKAAMRGLRPVSGAIAAAEGRFDDKSQGLINALRRMLLRAAVSGVETGAGQLETIGFGVDWTLVNEAARDWVMGVNPEQLAGKLRELFDQVQISSKRTLRQEIAGWIESGEKLPDLVKRLEPTFGKQRAELIASTEVTRAYAEGNTLAWREAGIVEIVECRTAADERVCPICGPQHKQRRNLDGVYENGLTRPPFHPRCRCWEVPVVETRRRNRG